MVRSRSGVAGLGDAVRRAAVFLDQFMSELDQLVLGLALVDDEEDVGGGDGLGRLQGEMVGIPGADADDE